MENMDCVKCHACCEGILISEIFNPDEATLWEKRGLVIEKIEGRLFVLTKPCKELLESGKCALWETVDRPKACELFIQGNAGCIGMRNLKQARGIK